MRVGRRYLFATSFATWPSRVPQTRRRHWVSSGQWLMGREPDGLRCSHRSRSGRRKRLFPARPRPAQQPACRRQSYRAKHHDRSSAGTGARNLLRGMPGRWWQLSEWRLRRLCVWCCETCHEASLSAAWAPSRNHTRAGYRTGITYRTWSDDGRSLRYMYRYACIPSNYTNLHYS